MTFEIIAPPTFNKALAKEFFKPSFFARLFQLALNKCFFEHDIRLSSFVVLLNHGIK